MASALYTALFPQKRKGLRTHLVMKEAHWMSQLTRMQCKLTWIAETFTEWHTFLWEWRRVSRCWCKSWRMETPRSSVSSIVLLLSLILSLDWFSLSVDIDNLSRWSPETCIFPISYKSFSSKFINSKHPTRKLFYGPGNHTWVLFFYLFNKTCNLGTQSLKYAALLHVQTKS